MFNLNIQYYSINFILKYFLIVLHAGNRNYIFQLYFLIFSSLSSLPHKSAGIAGNPHHRVIVTQLLPSAFVLKRGVEISSR